MAASWCGKSSFLPQLSGCHVVCVTADRDVMFDRSVEYLDEIEPGCFRQAQVTFSLRLPHVFAAGDAMSMSANVMTYSTNGPLDMMSGQ